MFQSTHRFVRLFLVVHALCALPLVAVAQETRQPGESVFVINDADPVSSVPTADQARQQPLEMGYFVMELGVRAEAAAKRGDHKQAAQYFRAMAKAVPERATGFSRACQEHAAAGEWDLALEVCRVALATDGVKAADLARFVQVLLQRPTALSPTDVADIDAVLAQLNQVVSKKRDEQSELRDLECQVGVKLEDPTRLRACAAAMVQLLGPNAPKSLVYAAALALQQGDTLQVERVIERARKAGLPAQAIAAMEKNLSARRPAEASVQTMVPRNVWLVSAVAMVLAALGLLVFGRLRRAPAR